MSGLKDLVGGACVAGSAPYLDYRPATDEERQLLQGQLDQPWLSQDLEQKALAFAAQHIVPEHLAALRKHRDELIDKSARAVRTRLTREIAYWDHGAQELTAREEAGKTPRINSTMARQRADELEARLAVGKSTVTVSATQIRYCCNQPDNSIFAVVQVDGDTAHAPRYLHGPFDEAPGFV